MRRTPAAAAARAKFSAPRRSCSSKLAEDPIERVSAEHAGIGFAAFKERLADLAIATPGPIAARMRALLADPAYIDGVLADGAARARRIADANLAEVRRIMGLLDA